MISWLDRAADVSRGEEKGAGVPTAKQETEQSTGSAPDPPKLEYNTHLILGILKIQHLVSYSRCPS